MLLEHFRCPPTYGGRERDGHAPDGRLEKPGFDRVLKGRNGIDGSAETAGL
jgi:hypothetical protein